MISKRPTLVGSGVRWIVAATVWAV